MKLLRASAPLLFAALGLVSCAGAATDPGPGKRVELEISKSAYLSGDTVSIGVINVSDLELTYPGGFCPQRLQRDAGGAWTDVSIAGPAQGCPLFIATMAPRERQTVYVRLPVDLESDSYRIVLPAAMVEIGDPAPGEPSLMMTQEFTVSSHTF
jgi:hypothetical protein